MLRRLALGAALVVGASVVLSGCTPPAPTETTSAAPTPSTSSTAPSLDEATLLANARAAWDAYQVRMSEFGANPASATLEPLEEVATADFAAFLLQNLKAAADRRLHTEGQRTTTEFTPADLTNAPRTLSVHVCVDLSGERVVGDEGIEITPQPESPQSQTVEFVDQGADSRYLVAGVRDFDGAAEDAPCV